MRPDGAVHAVHPALLRAFAALDDAGVAWCLLRGEARLADPSGDVDLLVDPVELPRLDPVLVRAGFLPVAGLGKGAHRGYVGRDAEGDRFLELDIEFSVEFGSSGHFAVNWLRPTLPTGAVHALLAGRRRVGALACRGSTTRSGPCCCTASSTRARSRSGTPPAWRSWRRRRGPTACSAR